TVENEVFPGRRSWGGASLQPGETSFYHVSSLLVWPTGKLLNTGINVVLDCDIRGFAREKPRFGREEPRFSPWRIWLCVGETSFSEGITRFFPTIDGPPV